MKSFEGNRQSNPFFRSAGVMLDQNLAKSTMTPLRAAMGLPFLVAG
jgi:hypothetical protein